MYNQKVKIQGQPLRSACSNHASNNQIKMVLPSNNQNKQVLAVITNLGWFYVLTLKWKLRSMF
jgi:hypothetical protein